MPLIDLTEDNGATEFALGTHTKEMTALASRSLRRDYAPQPRNPSKLPIARPLMKAGSLLVFDWRVWHRGGANQSAHDRPVAQITYAAHGVVAYSYKDDLLSLAAWLRARDDAPLATGGARKSMPQAQQASVANVIGSGGGTASTTSAAVCLVVLATASGVMTCSARTRRVVPHGHGALLLGGVLAGTLATMALAARRVRLGAPEPTAVNPSGAAATEAAPPPPPLPPEPAVAPTPPLRAKDMVCLEDGSFARLEALDAGSGTWRLSGSTRRVAESACSFAFRWMPSALSELRTAKGPPEVIDGPRHRTLRTQASFREGEVMFIDVPCLVVVNETARAYEARWQAYRDMDEQASHDPAYALLRQVLGDIVVDQASGGASAARATDGARAVAIAGGATAARGASIRRACLCLESNTVASDARGHWMAEGGDFLALYAFIAIMNHSCDPSADLGPGRTAEPRLHVRALIDLAPGDELTINYGPAELPSWPLAQRREYLLEHHSFVCACRRCQCEGASGCYGGGRG